MLTESKEPERKKRINYTLPEDQSIPLTPNTDCPTFAETSHFQIIDLMTYYNSLSSKQKNIALGELLKQNPDFSPEPEIHNFINIYNLLSTNHKSAALIEILKQSSITTLQQISCTILPLLKFLIDGEVADQAIWKKRIQLEGFAKESELNPTFITNFLNDSQSVNMYKEFYKHHHLTRQNWLLGRYRKVSFPGHGRHVVTSLQFDGDNIISGSDDHTIHIYDTKTGLLVKKLEGHAGGVWALQYWKSTLVSGSTDRTVRVWDMDTEECTHVFDGHTSTVRCLLIITPQLNENGVLEPSEPLIVTGSRDATLRVWKLPNPEDKKWNPSTGYQNPYFKYLFTGHTNSVRAIAGSGNVLVSGSYDTTVRVWNLDTGECSFIFEGHREKVYSIGYCHELKRAVSGSMDATVRVWCTQTGVNLFVLDGHNSLVGLLELTPKYLISAAADSTLRIWSPTTGECLGTLTGHTHAITCFHHDPIPNRIVSGSDGGVKIWELSTDGYGVSSSMHNLASIIPKSSKLRKSLHFTQGPNGPEPVYGRFIGDVVTNVVGVWRVRMDTYKLVSSVQVSEPGQEGHRTWFEVLDFTEHPDIGKEIKALGDRSSWDTVQTPEDIDAQRVILVDNFMEEGLDLGLLKLSFEAVDKAFNLDNASPTEQQLNVLFHSLPDTADYTMDEQQINTLWKTLNINFDSTDFSIASALGLLETTKPCIAHFIIIYKIIATIKGEYIRKLAVTVPKVSQEIKYWKDRKDSYWAIWKNIVQSIPEGLYTLLVNNTNIAQHLPWFFKMVPKKVQFTEDARSAFSLEPLSIYTNTRRKMNFKMAALSKINKIQAHCLGSLSYASFQSIFRTSVHFSTANDLGSFIEDDTRLNVLSSMKTLLNVTSPASDWNDAHNRLIVEIQNYLQSELEELDMISTAMNNLEKDYGELFQASNVVMNMGPVEFIKFAKIRVDFIYSNLDRTQVKFNQAITKYQRPPVYFRYWVPASAAVLGGIYCYRLFTLSSITNSLCNLSTDIVDTVKGFVNGWVLSPLKDMLKIIRHKDPKLAIMGKNSLKSDLDSLERMVVQFAKDYNPSIDAKLVAEQVESVKSLVAGTLIRSLLIQIQKVKVDGALAMSALDKLLSSNELNFAFLATIPTLLLTYAGVSWFLRYINSQKGLGATKKMDIVRFDLREIERIFNKDDTPENHVIGQLLVSLIELRSAVANAPLSSQHKKMFLEDVKDLEIFVLYERARGERGMAILNRIWRTVPGLTLSN
ncbi:SCF ubiquitin ligase complex subunit cdc4 [Terramyces sp. JEL0728]|nr:SCF ubiquitin ligase complex subunit cdc4 [Terramyces sp. JEL0728]